MTKQEGRLKFLSLRRDDLEARFPGLLDSVLSAPPMPPSAPLPIRHVLPELLDRARRARQRRADRPARHRQDHGRAARPGRGGHAR